MGKKKWDGVMVNGVGGNYCRGGKGEGQKKKFKTSVSFFSLLTCVFPLASPWAKEEEEEEEEEGGQWKG